eukprot:2398738-Amphidinium_carterae.2
MSQFCVSLAVLSGAGALALHTFVLFCAVWYLRSNAQIGSRAILASQINAPQASNVARAAFNCCSPQ